MRILRVGKLAVRSTLGGKLSRAGEVTFETVSTGGDALDLARHYAFTAVLLDLALPDLPGIEVVRRLRAAEIDAPVIAFTDIAEAQHKIAAFAEGADDVVTVPVDGAELLARIKAIVRRRHGLSKPAVSVGTVSFCVESRRVRVDGQEVSLTKKETSILELLMLKRNSVVTKSVITDHLYAGSPEEPNAKIVDVFVCNLRRKLAEAGAEHLITTVRGCGYEIADSLLDSRRSQASSLPAGLQQPYRFVARHSQSGERLAGHV